MGHSFKRRNAPFWILSWLLLVTGLLVATVLAVGLLPLFAIGYGSESGAVASYSTIAVFALRGDMIMCVDLDCSSISGHHISGRA